MINAEASVRDDVMSEYLAKLHQMGALLDDNVATCVILAPLGDEYENLAVTMDD